MTKIRSGATRSTPFFFFLLLIAGAAACSAPQAASTPQPPPAPTTVSVAPTSASAAPTSASVAPTAAATATSAQPKPASGGTLIYANSQKARSDSMDPATQSGLPAGQAVWLLYNQLVYFDPQKGAMPQLATSWEVSPDGKSYTFRLRTDVKFHDGTPLDAAAVKFSLERTVRPELKGQQAANYLQAIYVSTDVLDASTVRVNIKNSSTAFLYQMSRQIFGIVSPTAVNQLGDAKFALNPVGSGPYKFKELVSGDHVTLVRNPDYKWGPAAFINSGPAYPDQFIFRYLPEITTRLAALQTGEVNFIEDVPLQDVAGLEKDPRFKIYKKAPAGLSEAIQLNIKKAPTSELAVRQAIEFAINKEQINKAVFFGYSTPTYSLLGSPDMLGYDASIGESLYKFDQAQARQILDKAGWTLGTDGLRRKGDQVLKLQFITDTTSQVEELVQAQLREVGMQVELTRLDPAGAATAWKKGEHNLTLGSGGIQGRSNPDAEIISTAYTCSQVGTFNTSQYCDEAFDKQILAAVAIQDNAQRAAAYKELQKAILSQALSVPIVQYTKIWASTSKIQGVNLFDPGGVYIRLNGAWVQP
ncbi:MAG: hypothetical protein HY327_08895 [Chloroflexi bacterium]|nr:hypothetical protein [Chloroflexota bacterium]